MKVCKEMVDAMGAVQPLHYTLFKNFCFTAITILRKRLVTLMVDASILHIKLRDMHEQVPGKFCLNMT